MKDDKKTKKIFGLVGKNISYSFSRNYFSEKFKGLNLPNYEYLNFDIQQIDEFLDVIKRPCLSGLNVTIPYKEQIFPFMDKISKKAKEIGAINTIKITKKGKLKGFNTDEYGFRKSLKPLLKKKQKRALILGTGGASKAIAYALKKLKIKYKFVSRSKSKNHFLYSDLSLEILEKYTLIINCTPLGTHPNIERCPEIPYKYLTKKHLLYDLVYNPKESLFLQKGKEQGAGIKNGQEMLELQAEKAWKIWLK